MRYDWPALEPLTPKRPNKMTIPNIGYKANSIYERDAIFDELEKMGWPVEPPAERGDHMFICAHESGSKFWASNYVGGKDSPPLSPSPESFLTAAREALKPKYPTETLHAKCNSPFELRGCIQALHEAGVPVWEGTLKDSSEDNIYPDIEWQSEHNVISQCRQAGRDGEKVVPLSEFMDIFLKPDKTEPKRETPPKIVGRKYRVLQSHGWFVKGQTVTCQTHPTCEHIFVNEHRVSGTAQMHLLKLLPEEPWTAEYRGGQDVLLVGKVDEVLNSEVMVKIGDRYFGACKPSEIKPA